VLPTADRQVASELAGEVGRTMRAGEVGRTMRATFAPGTGATVGGLTS